MLCDCFFIFSDVVASYCEYQLFKSLGLTVQIGLNQFIPTCWGIISKFVTIIFLFLVSFWFFFNWFFRCNWVFNSSICDLEESICFQLYIPSHILASHSSDNCVPYFHSNCFCFLFLPRIIINGYFPFYYPWYE